MHDVTFWIAFFGAPLLLVLITAFVFRPSARGRYREAKREIFAEDSLQTDTVCVTAGGRCER